MAGIVKAVVAVAVNHDGASCTFGWRPFRIQASQKGGAIGCFEVHIGQVAKRFHQAGLQFDRALIIVGSYPEVLGANPDCDGAIK